MAEPRSIQGLRWELHQALAVVWAFITIILSVLLREETRWTLLLLWGVSLVLFCFYAVLSARTLWRARAGRVEHRGDEMA